MKRFSNAAYVISGGVCLFIFSILFTACRKDSIDNSSMHTPAAGLMAFNLIPDKAIGFTLSGNNLTNALSYTNFTGTYLPVLPGTQEVRSFDANTGSTLAIANQTFTDSSYYSVFAVGANGNYRNIVVEDKLAALTAAGGKAYVRYINAIPDSVNSPVVTISSGGTSIVNSSATYGSVSDFTTIAAGDIVITANNGGDINTTRTITVEQGKIYTILLQGLPSATDADKMVQIKFITNGSIN